MHPCSQCRRHVMTEATSCPFCGAAVKHGPAPLTIVAGIFVGLALGACGDDGGTTSVGETSVSTTMTGTETESTTGVTTTGNDAITDADVSVAAYGDPSFDSSITVDPETNSTGTGSSSGTDTDTDGTTAADSGSTDSSGTDSGSTSAATNVSDTADYGGASAGR